MTMYVARSDFEPLVDTQFEVQGEDDGPVLLRLNGVRDLGASLRGGGAFALTFAGPAAPLLPQATYRMTSDALGAIDIFIVPIGRDGNGLAYEAIYT